ncbi:MAG: glycosyltransferase [Bacteroidia bacterium]|nr:glycosyltransferase [Bacteroidia bacterium]
MPLIVCFDMKIICIGNYPPRKCGIATFTENLTQSIRTAAVAQKQDIEVEVIAMNDAGQEYDYPAIVSRTINESDKESYLNAAEYINQSGATICLLQHEYGIFGGNSGLLILTLLKQLKIPVITTLHTVLEKPSFHQKEVIRRIGVYSSKLVVMSKLAIDFLIRNFDIPRGKIIRIEHGVPDFELLRTNNPEKPGIFKNRKTLLTFGLISRNKGIETVIKAMPLIVKRHPDILFVVLGKTHPHVVKFHGEEYRTYLKKLTRELHLEEHVKFVNQYTTEEDLTKYLLSGDIYVTPYLNKAQITSGTLSYAVGAGLAVISTPYWHAEELLADDRGILFDFNDHLQLADIVNDLLDHPEKLDRFRNNAFNYGCQIAWPKIGNQYLDLFEEAKEAGKEQKSGSETTNSFYVPEFCFRHVERLTDYTSIIQHSKGCIPSYKTGYCLDDTSRALILSIKAYHRFGDQKYITFIHRYLAYLMYMQNQEGDFKNFLNYNRESFEVSGSDDAYGRAVWALGTLIRFADSDSLFQLAIELFNTSTRRISHLEYARGFANCILGFYHYIKRFPNQEQPIQILRLLADKLCNCYEKHKREDWDWFEASLTYDNGLLPAALYKAYQLIAHERYLTIADTTTRFLEKTCFKNDHLSIIGNKQWFRGGEEIPGFAQQPVDALAMIILYDTIHKIRRDDKSLNKIKICFGWFFGNNDLNLPLYDSETKGCNDGIEELNISQDQGAESIISYLMSWLIAEPYLTS